MGHALGPVGPIIDGSGHVRELTQATGDPAESGKDGQATRDYWPSMATLMDGAGMVVGCGVGVLGSACAFAAVQAVVMIMTRADAANMKVFGALTRGLQLSRAMPGRGVPPSSSVCLSNLMPCLR